MLLFHEPIPKGDAIVVVSIAGVSNGSVIYVNLSIMAGSSSQIEEMCGQHLGEFADLCTEYVDKGEHDTVDLHAELFLLPLVPENRELALTLLDYRTMEEGKDPKQAKRMLSLLAAEHDIPPEKQTVEYMLRLMAIGLYVALCKVVEPLYSIDPRKGKPIRPSEYILQTLWGVGKSRPSRGGEDSWFHKYIEDLDTYIALKEAK